MTSKKNGDGLAPYTYAAKCVAASNKLTGNKAAPPSWSSSAPGPSSSLPRHRGAKTKANTMLKSICNMKTRNKASKGKPNIAVDINDNIKMERANLPPDTDDTEGDVRSIDLAGDGSGHRGPGLGAGELEIVGQTQGEMVVTKGVEAAVEPDDQQPDDGPGHGGPGLGAGELEIVGQTQGEEEEAEQIDELEVYERQEEEREEPAVVNRPNPDVAHFGYKDIKKNMVIKYKKDGEVKTVEVVSRAGKVASIKGKGKEGKYEHHWNLRDQETGHISCCDTKSLEEISKVPAREENNARDESEDEVFAVNIPRHLHGDKECREAKEVELSRFDEFNAYEEVPDEGQECLGTNWVLTEKVKDGKTMVKARLCVRGDQEENADEVQRDSPTVRKSNINILLMAAARNKWPVKSQDVSSAFLQSVPIERDVYVKPPKERRIPGVVWKLNKTVYGLVDASRGFYLNFSGQLQTLGCEKAKMDPAMFIHFEENEMDDFHKEPSGLAVTHVDDMLSAGGNRFETEVIEKMKQQFKFGSEEEL